MANDDPDKDISRDLSNAEATGSAPKAGADGSVGDQENDSTPPEPMSDYKLNYTGWGEKRSRVKSIGAFLSGKGPLIAIGGGFTLAGGAIILIIPALLLFHLLANMLDTYDPSSTSLTQITKMVILNKLGANSKGVPVTCDVARFACRLKMPSNELLREMKAKGIVAYDSSGKPLTIPSDKKVKWPDKLPKWYAIGEGANTKLIDAKNIKAELRSNAQFRVAFNQVLKKVGARSFSKANPAFLRVAEKFKMNLRDTLGIKAKADTGDKKTVLSRLLVKGLKVVGLDAEAIKRVVSTAVSKTLERLAKASKGSGYVLLAALGCMATEVPGLVKKAMIGIQQTAIVGGGTPFVTAMSAGLAGDGDEVVMSQTGTKFTEKGSNGETALNAIGVRYATDGDKDTSSDPTYENVTPAAFGDQLTALDVADKLVKNPVSNIGCEALMNPWSASFIAAGVNALAVGLAPETFGISLALNAVLGLSISAAIQTFSGDVSNAIGEQVAPGLAEIAQPAIDKSAQPGQAFGNLVPASVGITATQTSSETWGATMPESDLVIYSQKVKEQKIADAEVDRATLSPLDASSEYTFLGSIVNQFMPYYASISSVSGGLSVLSSLLPISFASLMKGSTANAADEISRYEGACPDKERVTAPDGTKLAATIYCDAVWASIVSDDFDPSETADIMAAKKTATGAPVINEDTGLATTSNDLLTNLVTDVAGSLSTDPLEEPSYGDWKDACSDTQNAVLCLNDSDTKQMYSEYTASVVVTSMIDGEGLTAEEEESDDVSVMDLGLGESLLAKSDTTTDTSAAVGIAGMFGIASFVHDLFRQSNAQTFASATSDPFNNSLARFALWR